MFAKFSRDAVAERFSERNRKRSAVASRLNLADENYSNLMVSSSVSGMGLPAFVRVGSNHQSYTAT